MAAEDWDSKHGTNSWPKVFFLLIFYSQRFSPDGCLLKGQNTVSMTLLFFSFVFFFFLILSSIHVHAHSHILEYVFKMMFHFFVLCFNFSLDNWRLSSGLDQLEHNLSVFRVQNTFNQYTVFILFGSFTNNQNFYSLYFNVFYINWVKLYIFN